MVNLLTGPKGSGKTQQMIELANKRGKTSKGNVVLIKKSHRDTYSVDFSIRAVCMADYWEITTLAEFIGFIYGIAEGNHDIEAIFIDGVLKQADINLGNLPEFVEKLNQISKKTNIEFYISVSAEKNKLKGIDQASPDLNFLN